MIEKKVCYTCLQSKKVIYFGKDKYTYDGLANHCKECVSKRDKKYQIRYNEESKIRRQARRDKFWNIYGSCSVCGEDCINCLEFHHTNPDTKESEVSSLWGLKNPQRLTTEIRKCILLCRNCHSKVHFGIIEVSSIPKIIIPNDFFSP